MQVATAATYGVPAQNGSTASSTGLLVLLLVLVLVLVMHQY